MVTSKKIKSSAGSGRPKSSATTGAGVSLKKVKGENFYRTAKQATLLKMRSGGKPVYDRDGKVIQAAAFQKGEDETKPGRVQPDRRWFGNTRVISQKALDHFRTNLATRADDPYSVLLKRNKLPMGLLDDAKNSSARKRSHIVETEPFSDTFGPKAQRKRPRLEVGSFEDLSLRSQAAESTEGPAGAFMADDPDGFQQTHADHVEAIYYKGTSRRIYGELYKVIDSSDVVLHVLDARDPLGTLCDSVLDYIKKEKAHKQVVLLINKCDLVPNWVTARHVAHLSQRYPTLAFHASPQHSFGKGALISLLRQFSTLHSDKKQISVGLLGYPNVGKSSVINTLKSGTTCRVAPVPGETKVWQYVHLTRRIFLIDCPGIVTASKGDSRTDTVLKGVVRVEALPMPSEHIPALLERVKPIYLSRTYNLPLPEAGKWEADPFLDQLARSKGRLHKGGEPDIEGAAKIVLSDWVRGRIPFFVPPPDRPEGAKPQTQKLGGIMHKTKFVGEDVREAEDAQVEAEAEAAGADTVDGADEDDGGVQEGEELAWDDVFQEDSNNVAEPSQPSTSAKRDEDEDEEGEEWGGIQVEEGSDEEDEQSDDEASTKKQRMSTNKRKAQNYFTHANIKNKRRTQQPKPPGKSVKRLPGSSRPGGRR
ncbi:NGP1NT-domain-containing protein [Auriculariales sp. MPI-PUGE-AT-0066]|nr:NGP1NT-domain-containing protein [Auriculariales sp. MPI-PUGE-AT-0066]